MKEKVADMQEKIEELMNRPVPEPMPPIEIPAGADFDMNQLSSMFATKQSVANLESSLNDCVGT